MSRARATGPRSRIAFSPGDRRSVTPKMVGLVGIEPTTCALGVRRAIQLSYSPTLGF